MFYFTYRLSNTWWQSRQESLTENKRVGMLIRWLNWLINKWWSVMMPLGDPHMCVCTYARAHTHRDSCQGSLLRVDTATTQESAHPRPHACILSTGACSCWLLDLWFIVCAYFCVCVCMWHLQVQLNFFPLFLLLCALLQVGCFE